jgi:hypothetical protein
MIVICQGLSSNKIELFQEKLEPEQKTKIPHYPGATNP